LARCFVHQANKEIAMKIKSKVRAGRFTCV